MTHPTEIPELQAAIGALLVSQLPTVAPVEGPGISDEQALATAEAATNAIRAKVDEAQQSVSIVPACGMILDALAPHVDALSLPAARVLAGAAHLVLTRGFLGRAEEADGVRSAARARIAALGG